MTDFTNGLTAAEAERLAILIEEASEVTQIATKILRHGYASYHPDDPETSNAMLLHREVGDFFAAVDLMVDEKDLVVGLIGVCRRDKAERLKKWTHHQRWNK